MRGALDGSKVTVSNGEVEVGNVRLLTSLDLSRENPPPPSPPKYPGAPKEDRRMRYKLDATYRCPWSPAEALLDAAPKGLLPKVEGMRIAGSFSLKGKARFDTLTLDKDFAADYDVAKLVPRDRTLPRGRGQVQEGFYTQVYGPPASGSGPGEKEIRARDGAGDEPLGLLRGDFPVHGARRHDL